MEPGIHGAHGAAAVRLVVEASSRGRGSVRGLSLEENPAPVKPRSRSAAMTSDALVSGSKTANKWNIVQIKPSLGVKIQQKTHLIAWILSEPHEICTEQNIGDVVWKKTPAGDVAAVACPADASGTLPAWKLFLLVFGGFFLDFVYKDQPLFHINRPDSASLHPWRCGTRLLGEPNLHPVCLKELREYSDAGKPWIKKNIIKRLNF